MQISPTTNFILFVLFAGLSIGCTPTTDPAKPVPPNAENGSSNAETGNRVPGEQAPENSAPASQNQHTTNRTGQASQAAAPMDRTLPPTPPSEPVIVNNTEFHAALVDAANSYLEFGMVNTAALAALNDCRPAAPPAFPLQSKSDDSETHGDKLYFLFAKQVAHYLNQDGSPVPTGQILVKESWTSKPSNPNARNMRTHRSGIRINPRTIVGDQVLEIGQRKELFLMLKLATDTPDTDQGWVYGVVDSKTKQVSESGKVPSCIRCHEDANHDRLFGPSLLFP